MKIHNKKKSYYIGACLHGFYLILTKTYKFLRKKCIIHHKYLDYITTGVFIHVIFKFFIYLFSDIQFDGTFNLILLLLSIYLCTVIDIYYYIHYAIHRIIKYVFMYFRKIYPRDEFYTIEPESEFWRRHTRWLIKYESETISENYNLERDRYHFFKYFFLFFISIRYFIIKEPFIFSVIHLTLFIQYLQEYNPLLLSIYLIIIHMSKFIFFMGPNVERFKFKKWNESFLLLIQSIAEYLTLSHIIKIDTKLTYIRSNILLDKSLVLKMTKNNINLLTYFALKEQLTNKTELYVHGKTDTTIADYNKLSELFRHINIHTYELINNRSATLSTINLFFPKLYYHIPDLYVDSQRFVKKNQGFWLAAFVFFCYLDYKITTALIPVEPKSIETPAPLKNVNIEKTTKHKIFEIHRDSLSLVREIEQTDLPNSSESLLGSLFNRVTKNDPQYKNKLKEKILALEERDLLLLEREKHEKELLTMLRDTGAISDAEYKERINPEQPEIDPELGKLFKYLHDNKLKPQISVVEAVPEILLIEQIHTFLTVIVTFLGLPALIIYTLFKIKKKYGIKYIYIISIISLILIAISNTIFTIYK